MTRDEWNLFSRMLRNGAPSEAAAGLSRLGLLPGAQTAALRSEISGVLKNGNRFSKTLAAHFETQNVSLRFRRLGADDTAVFSPRSRSITINSDKYLDAAGAFRTAEDAYRAAVAVVHEGQHYFDFMAKAIAWTNKPLLEARAFLREAQFANDIGRPSYSTFGVIRARDGSAAAWRAVRDAYRF